MAQYRVLAKSFINSMLVQEGDVIEFDGKPGSNLELVKDEAPVAAPKGGKGKKPAAVPVDAEQGE